MMVSMEMRALPRGAAGVALLRTAGAASTERGSSIAVRCRGTVAPRRADDGRPVADEPPNGEHPGSMRRLVNRISHALESMRRLPLEEEATRLLLGRLLAETVRRRESVRSLREVEFRVFSQWGDDGIIQWLVHRLDIPHRWFVEFGVQDYRESNTRFLLQNDDWSGLVMDGDPDQVARIIASEWSWRHDLRAIAAFVDAANINDLLRGAGVPRELGVLHIDIDGNDYWVWKAIDAVDPIVAIIEYNAVFGGERAIVVPYDPAFQRTRAHFSNLYWGASLPALCRLASDRGYAFIGCNGAGNNAYFVKRDRLLGGVCERSIADGFVESRFRESRDERGRLTHLSGAARLERIRGLPVVNVETGALELL